MQNSGFLATPIKILADSLNLTLYAGTICVTFKFSVLKVTLIDTFSSKTLFAIFFTLNSKTIYSSKKYLVRLTKYSLDLSVTS